jgi:hypothetical protein
MKSALIKIPYVQYRQAKDYKNQLRASNGLDLPLWACMVENEKRNAQNKQLNDVNKMFRRLI